MGIDRAKVVDEEAFNKFAKSRLKTLHPDKYHGYEDRDKLDDAVKKFNNARDKIIELLRGGSRPPPIPSTPKAPRPPPTPRQPRQPQEPRQPSPPRPEAQGRPASTAKQSKPKQTERQSYSRKSRSKMGVSEEGKRMMRELMREREAAKKAEEAELRASLAREQARIREESIARQEEARRAIEKERLEAQARAEEARREIGRLAKEREQRLARKKRAVTPPLGATRNKKLKDRVTGERSALGKLKWARRVQRILAESAEEELRKLEIVRLKQRAEIDDKRYKEAVRKAKEEYEKAKRLTRKRKYDDISKMPFSAGTYYKPRLAKTRK